MIPVVESTSTATITAGITTALPEHQHSGNEPFCRVKTCLSDNVNLKMTRLTRDL